MPRNASSSPTKTKVAVPEKKEGSAAVNVNSTDFKVTEDNIDDVESLTIENVNKTITVLEGSLATWEASKEKPKDLVDRFEKYKKLRDALTDWETKILKGRVKSEQLSFDKRLQRLRDFIDICYAYA